MFNMNNFNSSVLLVSVLGYIGYALKTIPSMLFDFWYKKHVSTISVSSDDPIIYNNINQWILKMDNKILKNNINIKESWNSNSSSCTDFSGYTSSINTINYGQYFINLDKFTIMIISKNKEKTPTSNVIDFLSITIFGFNRNKYLKEIIDITHIPNDKDKLCIIADNSRYKVPKKSFKNIFNPCTDTIIKYLENWKSQKFIYDKHEIIYKTGILLYGEPGTGKTTISRAIASYLDYKLYVISVKNFSVKELVSFVLSIPERSVILFEDIDCIISNREDSNIKNEEKNNIGILLNILDGMYSPNHVVFVATTNRLNTLDKAITRPGRFDLKMEIENINRINAIEMCNSFDINQSILADESFPINPSYLQSKIMRQKNTVRD